MFAYFAIDQNLKFFRAILSLIYIYIGIERLRFGPGRRTEIPLVRGTLSQNTIIDRARDGASSSIRLACARGNPFNSNTITNLNSFGVAEINE